MRRLILLTALSAFSILSFATGEPSTYFNIFVPSNNDAVQRNVALIVTAIYDSTSFVISDDGLDGDTDDCVSGILMAGQSYVLYIKDNGINDDAQYASGGTLKRDGDYFTITSTNLVYAAMSTDSDWQHDFVPATNKSSLGEKFIIYAPKVSSSNRDLNVFVYENNTTITISKISFLPTTATGYTNIDLSSKTIVVQKTLNVGQDIIHYYQDGRNVMTSGDTYLVESNRPVSVQYGALYQNERDGGGYVPSANGSCSGELFYFAVPYQAAGEQEIRIVSWDNTNSVVLDRYNNGSWVNMSTWTIDRGKAKDWVGKNNGNVSYPTVFRVSCTAGKKVSVFEANWLETGSPGTSDIATMVASEAGNTSGKMFLVYMAPPGNEQNVANPLTGTLYGQRLTHVYLFSLQGATVTVKDAYTNGLDINRTYQISPGGYVDCNLTENEWKSIYNNTGTIAGGPERPYLMIESNNNISVMNTNFNDNWMMYFGSALQQSFSQEGNSSQTTAIPGDVVTITSDIQIDQSGTVTQPNIEVVVGSGAVVINSEFKNNTDNTSIDGDIQVNENNTIITFDNIPPLSADKSYEVQTEISLLPSYNDGTPMPDNTIVPVEVVVSGNIGGTYQQSTVSEGIQNRTSVTTNLLFSACGAAPLTGTNGNNWGVCWTDIDGDDDDDLFVPDKSAGAANRFFKNNGNGTFTAITTGAIVLDDAIAVAATWGDVDNDGDQDALLANDTQRKCELYINQGNGTFLRKANTGLTQEPGYYHGAAWIDFNKDNKLDLTLTNYFPTRFNELWIGNGDGTFTNSNGIISNSSNNSLTPCWSDYDRDGWMDLFIPNTDGQNNQLFHNVNGTFEEVTIGDVVHNGGHSVAACWGDYDNDRWPDLYVANTSGENDFLYHNNGNGTFTRIMTGEVVTSGGHSHGCSWADVDNDADLDLYVTNDQGPKFLFINEGNGNFSKKINEMITMDFSDSFGHAWSDYDKNGFPDLFVATHGNNPDFLFCNNGNSNKWMSIRLTGSGSNKSAIGARIELKSGGIWQSREVHAQSGFASQNSLRQSFGLAASTIADSLVIYWPSGYKQVMTNLNCNQHLNIVEPSMSKVTGIAFHDANSNCVLDLDENYLANMNIQISPVGMVAQTNNMGEFTVYLPNGTYSLQGQNQGEWSACGAQNMVVQFSSMPVMTKNVGFTALTNIGDAYVVMGCTAWRRGFKNQTVVEYGNAGTKNLIGTELSITYPTNLYLLSASIPWDEKSGNTYTWKNLDISPQQVNTIYLTDSVGLQPSIGDKLEIGSMITTNESEILYENNSFYLNNEIVGAIDPNDMLVFPIGEGTEGFISKYEWVNYRVRFQNVGNYPAWKVNIEDQLPDFFDPTTLELVGSSHSCSFSLSESGLLSVIFDGIQLPDSTMDEVGSHGYMEFRIKPKYELHGGEILKNSATITFDYEAALKTNDVQNRIKYQLHPLNEKLSVFPNPVQSATQIMIDNGGEFIEGHDRIASIEILSNDGRSIYFRTELNESILQLDCSFLIPGMYVLRVSDQEGLMYYGKLTKQ